MKYFHFCFLSVSLAVAFPASAQAPIDLLPGVNEETYDGGLEEQVGEYLRALQPDQRLGAEQALLEILFDPNSSLEGRKMACRALLTCSSDASPTVLAPLLSDPELAHLVRAVIENTAGETADQVLVSALTQTDGDNWKGVVDSLGIRRTAAAVEPLAMVAAGDDPEKKAVAIRALGRIGDVRCFAVLSQLEVDGDLERLRVEAVLKAGQNLVRGQHYLPAVAATMRDLIADENTPPTTMAAYRLLIQAQPENAAEILTELLSSDDPAIRLMGASALDLVVSGDGANQLLARWPVLPGESKARVLTHLTSSGRAEVLGVARTSLNDGDTTTRVSAIAAVGRFGSADDLPVLYSLIPEGGEIEAAAVDALARLPDTSVDALLIAEFLRTESPIRAELTSVFAARHAVDALPVLLGAASNADARFSAGIYRAVGSLGGVDLVPVLLEKRKSAVSSARLPIERAIIEIGRRVGDGQVVPILISSWPTGDEAEDTAIIRIVAAIGDSVALDFLTSLVGQPTPLPAALNSVSRWTSPDVLPVLESIVRRKELSESDRHSAWQGMLRLNSELGWPHREAQVKWAGVLLETALSTNDQLRALEGFGRLNNPRMVDFLGQWVGDPELGNAALAAQESVRHLTEN